MTAGRETSKDRAVLNRRLGKCSAVTMNKVKHKFHLITTVKFNMHIE